jgi:DNA-binding NarL/FixJ family response regulator
MPHAPISIVVAEDNAIFAHGLTELLGAMPEVAVLEVAGDRDTAVVAVQRHTPDVVITDLRMPPTSTDEGLQVAQRARAHSGRTGVIVFSQFAEAAVAATLLAGGESRCGYLLKDNVANPAELLDAIRRVHSGGTVIDAALVQALALQEAAHHDPLAPLTPAERDVMHLIAQGYGNDGIAKRLSVGRSAVEKHVTAIFRKLPIDAGPDGNRRVQATLYYLANTATAPSS